jgi:ribosomal protein L11 methyltransferase
MQPTQGNEQTNGFIEAKIEIPAEHVDAVSNFIIEQIANGIVMDEEEDQELTGLTFYVPWTKAAQYRAILETYLADVLGTTPSIREKRVDDVAWIDEYKASIKPLVIEPDIVIRPTWAASPIVTPYDIVIEPKMAFGTGSHETTRGCLISIRQIFQSGWRMLDIGTGSGILAILAAKMGASYLKAVDYDIVAVENCKENFPLNGVTVPSDILHGSIETAASDTPYDMVCANIIRSAILPMLPQLITATRKNGWLLLSGLLASDETIISAALATEKQTEFSIHREGEWLTYRVQIQ